MAEHERSRVSREWAESYLPVADSPSWNWTLGRQKRVQRSEQKREGKKKAWGSTSDGDKSKDERDARLVQ